jgi:flavin-dependent dehydrogenase
MRAFAQVGVVGAGPAGARAAELLAGQGVDVLLLDPKAPWEKPCGGGLTPALFDELPELEEIRPLARPVHVARVQVGAEIGFDVPLDRPLWVISRESLGRWQLGRALAAGAVHERARVTSIRRGPRGWMLDTDRGAVGVGMLVGADGAASLARRATGCGLRLECLAARVEFPREEAATPGAIVLRFYPGVVGYLWDFPRSGHRSVGMEATSGEISRASLDANIDSYLARRRPSGDQVRIGAVIGTARLGRGRFSRMGGDGYALLGDAAGLADPFTGEGICNALRSAALLACAYRTGRPDWPIAYARLARRTFAKELAAGWFLRWALSESGLGVSLVERAVTSDRAYAFVAAMLNSLAEHDYGPARFLRRWRGAADSSSSDRPLPPAFLASTPIR